MSTAQSDLAAYESCDDIIASGLSTFQRVGSALMEMRNGKLYRAGGFASFEDYCKTRHAIARSRAYQLMDAATALENVHRGGQSAPSERTLRPLAALRDEPEKQKQAFDRAVELAEGEEPSDVHTQQAVDEIRNETPPLAPIQDGMTLFRALHAADKAASNLIAAIDECARVVGALEQAPAGPGVDKLLINLVAAEDASKRLRGLFLYSHEVFKK